MKDLQQNFLPEDFKPLLDKAKIDGSIAIQSIQSETENKYLLGLAAKNDWIKGIIGWLDLRKKGVKEQLEILSSNEKFKGLRHNFQHERDPGYMLNYRFNRGISFLKDFDLVFEILMHQKQLDYAIEFVQRHPYTKLVIDDMAKPPVKRGETEPWKSKLMELGECENLYCKISGILTLADREKWKEKDLTPYLDAAMEAFGPERIIFGSDWPISSLASPFDKTVALYNKYVKSLSKDEQEAVMGLNAAKLYNIS